MFSNIYPTLCQVCATFLGLKKGLARQTVFLEKRNKNKERERERNKRNTERIRTRVVAEASGVSVLCVSYLMSETEL